MNGAFGSGSDTASSSLQVSEYDLEIEKLANSDFVDADWGELRDMIKRKLDENIKSFMADPPPSSPPVIPDTQSFVQFPSMSTSQQTPSTGETSYSPRTIATTPVKYPPFPRRPVDRNEYKSQGRQKMVLTAEETNTLKENIFRLLHDFEGYPPFTIQRICELTLYPRKHYKYLGKYLRAVERALLITSTIDAFPIIPPEDSESSSALAGSLREVTTPLFSPIPFLHEDARRSRSRSPPMSPLQLPTASGASNPNSEPLSLGPSAVALGANPSSGGLESSEVSALGLVDELDDPSPGHLSERPTALTSTTSITSEAGPSSTAGSTSPSTPPSGKPMFGGSLGDRFVRATPEGENTESNEPMDETENDADKENVKT